MELTDEQLEERRRRKAERKRARRDVQLAKRKKAQLLSGVKMNKADPKNQCKALTRSSRRPCPMFRAILEHPETGKLYMAATCYAHLPQKIREEFKTTEIGGAAASKGNPGPVNRRPKPNEVLRHMFEQEAVEWIKPYLDALKAMKPIVVGNGRHARVEMVPDHRTRQQAAEAVWDRVTGKPRQQMEHSGPGGGAIPVEVPNDKDRQKAVAQILAEAGAIPNQQEKVKKTAMAARAAETN